jgi:UDP-N-acetylglucosamine acyltransferase
MGRSIDRMTMRIGERTVIREYVTIHRATRPEGWTEIGADCLLMAVAHVAHDCSLGNHVIVANNVVMGGHDWIGDHAVIGGLVAIHQFCRIGKMCIIGGCSKVVQDVPPFMMADGNPAETRTINKVGMERNSVPAEAQSALKHAYKILFREGLTVSNAINRLQAEVPPLPEVQHLLQFIRQSQRGIGKPSSRRAAAGRLIAVTASSFREEEAKARLRFLIGDA